MEIQEQLNLVVTGNISEIKDNSDEMLNRMMIILNNGYQISVISGEHAYCTIGSTFEIAIQNKDGEFCPHLYIEEDKGDNVIGHCPVEKVNEYIKKVGNLAPC